VRNMIVRKRERRKKTSNSLLSCLVKIIVFNWSKLILTFHFIFIRHLFHFLFLFLFIFILLFLFFFFDFVALLAHCSFIRCQNIGATG
jgi:hypothetical protein